MTKFVTKLQCAFFILFFRNTLQERCISSVIILNEWLKATGMNTISGSPKKWLAYFDLRHTHTQKQLFVGMPHSCEIALVANKTT